MNGEQVKMALKCKFNPINPESKIQKQFLQRILPKS